MTSSVAKSMNEARGEIELMDNEGVLKSLSLKSQSEWLQELERALKMSYDHPWFEIKRMIDIKRFLEINT